MFLEQFVIILCYFVRSGASILTIGGAAVLATVGGSVVLAKTSDGFRKFAEQNIPGTSFLFSLLLGPPLPQLPKLEPPSKYNALFY